MIAAIILAKSFSRRIKSKNTKKLNGKPILFYPILSLKKSKFFNKIFISSDGKKINSYSKKLQIDTNLIRPKNLSSSTSTVLDVMQFEAKKIKENYPEIKFILCTFATSIFFKKYHLAKAIKSIKQKQNFFIFTVKKLDSRILKSFYIKNNKCNFLIKKNRNADSKKLEKIYNDVGQFYLTSVDNWILKKDIDRQKNKLIEINNAIDIDNSKDWKKVKKIYEKSYDKRNNK